MVPDHTMLVRLILMIGLSLSATAAFAHIERLSSDGMMAVTVLDDKIRVTETKGGRLVHPLFKFSGVASAAITSLAISDDGAFVAFAAGGIRPELFEAATGRKVALDIPEGLGHPVHVVFTERGDYLLAKTDTGSLLAWTTDDGDLKIIARGGSAKLKHVGPFGVLPGDLKYIYDAPDNVRSAVTPLLVTITGTPLTRIQALTELSIPEGSETRDIAFSEDGSAVAVADKDGVTLRYKPVGGSQETFRIEGSAPDQMEVLGVAISGQGERIAILMPGGLQVFDLHGGVEPHVIPIALPAGIKYASVRFHSFNAVALVADGMATPQVHRIPPSAGAAGGCGPQVADPKAD